MSQGEDLHEAIASLRTDHKLLAQRVETVVEDVSDLRSDLDAKHRENRNSIHELRNNDQTILESLHVMQSFFGENGALSYMKQKIKDYDLQNKWIIALLITTLVGVIVTLATKH